MHAGLVEYAVQHLALNAEQGHLHWCRSHVRQHIPNLQAAPATSAPPLHISRQLSCCITCF